MPTEQNQNVVLAHTLKYTQHSCLKWATLFFSTKKENQLTQKSQYLINYANLLKWEKSIISKLKQFLFF